MLTQSKTEVLSVLLIVTVKVAQCEDGLVWRIAWIINAEQLLKQNTRKRSNDVAGQRKELQEHTQPPSCKGTCAVLSLSHISLKLPGSSISKCILSHLTGYRTLSSSDSNDLASIFHIFVVSFPSFSTVKAPGMKPAAQRKFSLAQPAAVHLPQQHRSCRHGKPQITYIRFP